MKTVFEKYPDAKEILSRWQKEWRFFYTVMNNSQREIARTHIATSTIYNDPSDHYFHDKLIKDLDLAVEGITGITGFENILDHNPVIQRSIQFRNPFTYPLNIIQSELLKRWDSVKTDEEKAELTELIFLNINGIAAAMQSTG